jgi:Sec-independent protein secretion pathway component TatC
MIQPAVLGGLFWFSIWCVVLGYILELSKEPIKDQKPQTLTRQKILNNATKLIVAISALLPMPIFAMILSFGLKPMEILSNLWIC